MPDDLALPFASGENWTISQGFGNKLTELNEADEVVPVYFDGGHGSLTAVMRASTGVAAQALPSMPWPQDV